MMEPWKLVVLAFGYLFFGAAYLMSWESEIPEQKKTLVTNPVRVVVFIAWPLYFAADLFTIAMRLGK